MYCTYRT